MKSRAMRWAGNAARVMKMRRTKLCYKQLKGRRGHMGDLEIDGRIILQWMY
jgi:hypothetical protein